jgi:hypothetical protein
MGQIKFLEEIQEYEDFISKNKNNDLASIAVKQCKEEIIKLRKKCQDLRDNRLDILLNE